jgi:hypothetical protein
MEMFIPLNKYQIQLMFLYSCSFEGGLKISKETFLSDYMALGGFECYYSVN